MSIYGISNRSIKPNKHMSVNNEDYTQSSDKFIKVIDTSNTSLSSLVDSYNTKCDTSHIHLDIEDDISDAIRRAGHEDKTDSQRNNFTHEFVEDDEYEKGEHDAFRLIDEYVDDDVSQNTNNSEDDSESGLSLESISSSDSSGIIKNVDLSNIPMVEYTTTTTEADVIIDALRENLSTSIRTNNHDNNNDNNNDSTNNHDNNNNNNEYDCPLIGFKNDGGYTCYINSILQCFMAIDYVVGYFLSKDYDSYVEMNIIDRLCKEHDKELNDKAKVNDDSDDDDDDGWTIKGSILSEKKLDTLSNIVYDMIHCLYSQKYPTKITKDQILDKIKEKIPMTRGRDQQDVPEFWGYLLAQLEKEMKLHGCITNPVVITPDVKKFTKLFDSKMKIYREQSKILTETKAKLDSFTKSTSDELKQITEQENCGVESLVLRYNKQIKDQDDKLVKLNNDIIQLKNDNVTEYITIKCKEFWSNYVSDTKNGSGENQSMISDIFYYTTISKQTCDTCNGFQIKVDTDNVVRIPIEKSEKTQNLQDLINCNASTLERMTGDNKYECVNCRSKQDARIERFNWDYPEIMAVQFVLFRPDPTNPIKMQKIQTPVSYPMILDMNNVVSEHAKNVKYEYRYRLIGFIKHSGPYGFGHYTAFTKNPMDGNWYYYDDTFVAQASLERVMDETPYMLFYQRIDSDIDGELVDNSITGTPPPYASTSSDDKSN